MRLKNLFERKLASISEDEVVKYVINYPADDDFNHVNIDKNEFDYVVKRLQKRLVGGKLTLFRQIAVVGDINEFLMKRRAVGTSWTYDQSAANVYRDTTRGYGEKFTLVSEVKEDEVDWLFTIALNMVPVRGRFESEVRLTTNTPLKIVKVLDESGNPIDLQQSILSKTFRA